MRSLLAILAALSVGSVSIAACSSTHSDEHAQHEADAAPSDDDDMDTDTDMDAGGGDVTPSATLKAPVIEEIMAMAGGLHVMWTNKQTDCDSIEGERKSDTEDYKVAFKVDGTVDNKHDAPLDPGTTYTYRLRCKKSADYSPYSKEKSGTPE